MTLESSRPCSNFASALTFLLGGWVAYALAGRFGVAWLLPFTAANFLCIAAADLIPELPGCSRRRRALPPIA